MKITYLSSTDLKRKTAEILNLVRFGETIAVIERHGKPLVKILPIKENKIEESLKEKLNNYFGAIPDFPDVKHKRYFRNKKISL